MNSRKNRRKNSGLKQYDFVTIEGGVLAGSLGYLVDDLGDFNADVMIVKPSPGALSYGISKGMTAQVKPIWLTPTAHGEWSNPKRNLYRKAALKVGDTVRLPHGNGEVVEINQRGWVRVSGKAGGWFPMAAISGLKVTKNRKNRKNSRRNSEKVTVMDTDGFRHKLDWSTPVWSIRLRGDKYEPFKLMAGHAAARTPNEMVFMSEWEAGREAKEATRSL